MNARIIRRWLAALLLSLGLFSTAPPLLAQQPKLGPPVTLEGAIPPALPRDPVMEVPNFLGQFYARGTLVNRPSVTESFTFTGRANDTGGAFIFFAPFTSSMGTGLAGPGGPYDISSNVTGKVTVLPTVILDQNAELTGLIQSKFPGATFVNGVGNAGNGTILFNYLRTIGADFAVLINLANPAGGGLVGRNLYFDNGSPIPQDRVYFFYNHVGSYPALGTPFDINRYVFGFEKTFYDGLFSLELRVPFAGTANSDQVTGQDLSVGHSEFGNLGLVFKGVLFRTPTLLVSAGLGISVPTADTSRLTVNGKSIVEIQNRAVLLQPVFGVAWAPSDRVYGQLGVQFDFDPCTNPVNTVDASGNPYRAGALRDYSYAFVSGAAGWWVYRNDAATLTRLALQGELHFDAAMGQQHLVRDGNILIGDFAGRTVLNGTAGVVALFGPRASLSLGVSFPLAGDRLYDWNLIAQLNYRFGPRVP